MMSTILGTAADELTAPTPALAQAPKPAWKTPTFFAWVLVSLTILVGSAILNNIEDQSAGSEPTPERVGVVSAR